MIYGPVPPGGGRPGRYPPGEQRPGERELRYALYLVCRSGSALGGASARFDPSNGRAALYCPTEGGGGSLPCGGSRAPAGGRAPVQWRNYATATWPYWGGAGLRPLTPSPPAAGCPCRSIPAPRELGVGGSYPVTARGRLITLHLSSVGGVRSSGGVRSVRRAACSLPLRGASCAAVALRIIWRILSLMVPPGGAGRAFILFPLVFCELFEFAAGAAVKVAVMA